MVAFYCFLCLVLEHRPRYWVYLGISLGVGLEVKYTIGGLVAAIVIAILLHSQAAFGTADTVSLDCGRDRAPHLGAEPWGKLQKVSHRLSS